MLEDFACELRSKDVMGCESITNVSNRVWGAYTGGFTHVELLSRPLPF